MKLIDLVKICDRGYMKDFPESSLLELVDENGLPHDPAPLGHDTLALFVVRELHDTYDPQATDAKQTEEAHRVISNARENLDNILFELTYFQD